MDISVALNAPRRRDLEFYEADDSEINVTVYAKDGDVDPVAATNVTLAWGAYGDLDGAMTVGGGTFTADFNPRSPYSIRGTVAGNSVTLAYGLINRAWDPTLYACCSYWDDRIFTHLSPAEGTFLELEYGDLLVSEDGDMLDIT